MPFLYHPNSDGDRSNVLTNMHGLIFTPEGEPKEDAKKIFLKGTMEHLKLFAPRFNTAYNNRNLAISERSKATMQKDIKKEIVKKLISHYFQNLNNGIERGLFKSSDRNLYGLDAGGNDVPVIISVNSILHWGALIIDGEAARMAQGGVSMAMPSADEVKTALDDFKAVLKQQSDKKIGLTAEQEEIQKLRDEADELIVDLWDEVEFYFRKSEPAAHRLQCSQWGVIYKNRYGDNTSGNENPPPTNPG
ncbi:MAG: hypothetical protein M0R21_07175 [Lentimicrobiaceae bacterium]|jgi:hypothetical protein|nr:hypothetical protein [Lentimicrobiaceae bacterium]